MTGVSGASAAVMAHQPSERERQVIELLAAGLPYATIGQRLYLTLDTVKTHTSRLFRKAEVRNQAQLVHWAWVNGYLGDRKLLQADNAKLRTQIENLGNQVDNLESMYQVAVAGPRNDRHRAAAKALERAEVEVRKARAALSLLRTP